MKKNVKAKKTEKKKVLPVIIVTVVIVAALLYFLQLLVMPKYVTDVPEGSMVSEYYMEGNACGNDVIFFGDCEAYEVFSPAILWEKYGITSYVRGTAQQMVWMSYYLMEDTLKTEKPKVIVFSVCDMMHADPDDTTNSDEREAYNRMTIDGMHWSKAKWDMINASMTSEEREKSGMWSYIFPVLRFHDRLLELTPEDTQYLFKKEEVTDNGYLMQVKVKPFTGEYHSMPKPDYTFSDMCYEYLDKIRQLCEREGIELVLVKSPSKYPVWEPQYEEQIEDYAREHDLLYINLLEHEAEYGLNWNEDTYDAGLHLNVYGVEKVSDYFGKYLTEHIDLTDHRSDPDEWAKWSAKVDKYNARKALLESMEE